ncbi:MAG: hemerythrin domain-containing protein [Nitrososphaerota archaeon]|nr:hemerythrin domain-containing protein [Nitrososphaerota archaeon]MDG7023932.1 hemerythrin domain-containing protein [Nitrososphaerota archaeon]
MASTSSRIDFTEPIPKVVERLKEEHRALEVKLEEIAAACKTDPTSAVSQLQAVRKQILHHSVEEEARIIRVILQRLKPDSAESVRIMQEHRWVVEFLERTLVALRNAAPEKIRKDVLKFVEDLRSHFEEEEREVFPLALRASRAG